MYKHLQNVQSSGHGFPRFSIVSKLLLLTVVVLLWTPSRVNAKDIDAFHPWLDVDSPGQSLRANSNEAQSCTEDKASLIYFKKFILLLFNRKELHYDKDLGQYERSLVLSLNSQQLEKLEQLQDPRDLDIILAEILRNIRLPYKTQECVKFFSVRWWGMLQNSIPGPEVRFGLLCAGCLLAGWYLHRYWGIRWYQLFFGMTFLTGYFFTYLDCNQELEANKMKKVLLKGETDGGSVFSSILSGLSFSTKSSPSSLQSEDVERLLPSKKFSLPYCRPDYVFVRYITETFTYYTESIFRDSVLSLQSIMGSLSFPYNLCAIPIFICTLQFFMKMLFKYVLSASVMSWRKHSYSSPMSDHQFRRHSNGPINPGKHLSVEDRLSGENLKMLLETINAAQRTKSSGVEEITDKIENCSRALTNGKRPFSAIDDAGTDTESVSERPLQIETATEKANFKKND